MMKKNAALAGALNLIPGVGYVYVGTRIPFGVLLLLIWPVAIIGGILEPEWLNTTYKWFVTDYICILIVASAFVADAYLEAERLTHKS